MKKPYQKKQKDAWVRTVFNNFHEPAFQPNKLTKYYAVIKVKDSSYLTEYSARFRSEAVAVFEEESRLSGGQVEVIGVYK
jgi:hypothetical protein